VLTVLACGNSTRPTAASAPTFPSADPAWCDEDGDGFCPTPIWSDCNDDDPLIHPGAEPGFIQEIEFRDWGREMAVLSPAYLIPLHYPVAATLSPSGRVMVQEHVSGRISILRTQNLHPGQSKIYLPLVIH